MMFSLTSRRLPLRRRVALQIVLFFTLCLLAHISVFPVSAQVNPPVSACGMPLQGLIHVSATYNLSSNCELTGELHIRKHDHVDAMTVTINGNGYPIYPANIGLPINLGQGIVNLNRVTVDATGRSAIGSVIDGSGTLNANHVTFKGSELMLNVANVNLSNSLLEDNHRSVVGQEQNATAIEIRSGRTATLNNVVLRNNTGGPGAIKVLSGGTLITKGCLGLSGNTPRDVLVLPSGTWTDQRTGACTGSVGNTMPQFKRNLSASLGTVGDFFFILDIAAMPGVTDTIDVIIHQGGVRLARKSYQVTKNTTPFSLRVGNLWDSNFDPANSLIKPGTTYAVKVDSIAGTRVMSSQSFTITTAAERICHKLGGATTYQNCPEVNISHENHSDSSLEFRIVPVPGASYYKVPGQLKCGVAMDQGFPGHLTSLGELLKWTPGPRVIKGGDWRDIYKDEYTVYYTCLRANHSFKVTIEAHQYYTVTGVSNGESFSSKQSRLIAKSTMFMSTKPRIASSQQLGQQVAPTASPSPTAIPPIYIEVDYHGNHDTDVTLSWSAVNRASRYVLQVGGYTFNLGRSETSQRVNGLTPGADYTAYLTVYLPYGKKRTGTAHFGMADSLPTNTPIPPTSTPVPQQSSQDSVQDQSPQQLQYSQQQAEDDEPQPSGPYASLISTLIGYQDETQHGDAHVLRWTRALAALGWGSHANPMTLQEAKDMADTYSRGRWQPVVDALTVLQPPPPPTNTPVPPPPTNTPIPPPPPTNTPIPPPPPTNTPVPPPPPTNTPVPPPPPTNTPIPPPPPTNTPIPPPPPTNTPVPPPPEPEPEPEEEKYTVPQSLINTLKGYQAETQHGDAHVERWTRALAALGHGSHDRPMTLSEAEDMADKYTAKRWKPVIDALEKLGK